jgi:hypothetical protein
VTAADAAALYQGVLNGSLTAADATSSSGNKQGTNRPLAAAVTAAAAGHMAAAVSEAGTAAVSRPPLGPEQRQSTFMRCVTHTLLDRLAASNSASAPEAAPAAIPAAVTPSSMEELPDGGGFAAKQQQQQQVLLSELQQQQHVATLPSVLHDAQEHPLQQDDNEESSRPGTSGTSYSALSIYTDQQLTARSNACDAEAIALQRWQQQQQQKQHGAYLAAAAAAVDRDDSSSSAAAEAAAETAVSSSITPSSHAVCSTSQSSTTPSSSSSSSSSSDPSSRTTTATSTLTSSSDTSAATSSATQAATPTTAAAAAAAGGDVLALQQFQAALVLLSRKCFPRIANAARAWKLLIERHIQPLADRKRSR